ncbi:MAG: tetratricopeptide repeat protein [Planctomycetota bacterium]
MGPGTGFAGEVKASMARVGKRIDGFRAVLAAAMALGLVSGLSLTGCVTDATPTEDPALVALESGEALLDSGDQAAALAEFERAIAVNPELSTAYLGAGDVYRRTGNYQAAEERYRAAAELQPDSFRAQYSHGLSLQLLQRATDAIRAYLRALAIEPGDFAANLNLAIAYLSMNEPGQARPFAERAVDARPDDGPARINLAATYSRLGRHEEAVVEYQQAAELTDLTPPLLLGLADSLGRTGRYAEMAATLEQLVRVEPSAAAYERLGSAWFRLKAYEDALRAFRGSVRQDEDYYPAWNGIGVCLLNRYLWERGADERIRSAAIEALRRSLRLKRNQPRIVELVRRYG